MHRTSIVFVPVIAVIAGFSIFVATLLICVDLIPAAAGDEWQHRQADARALADSAPGFNRSAPFSKTNGVEKEGLEAIASGGEPADVPARQYRAHPLEAAATYLEESGFAQESEGLRQRAEEVRRLQVEDDGRILEMQRRIAELEHEVEELRRAVSNTP